MVLLAALLPNALELLNTLFGLAKLPPFNWQAMAQRAVNAPWTDGLFVTGMLMTPLVPCFVAPCHRALPACLQGSRPARARQPKLFPIIPKWGLAPDELPPVKFALAYFARLVSARRRDHRGLHRAW